MFPWCVLQGDQGRSLVSAAIICDEGISTRTMVIPRHDVYVKVYSDPFDILCLHEATADETVTGRLTFNLNNSKHLETEVVTREELVRILGEAADVDRIAAVRTTFHPTDPGRAYVRCQVNGTGEICDRDVFVGHEPLQVENFQCESSWEIKLQCHW